MSIITVRCRLVAGVKQQINKKSIENFSAEEQILLQNLLDEKIQVELDKKALHYLVCSINSMSRE